MIIDFKCSIPKYKSKVALWKDMQTYSGGDLDPDTMNKLASLPEQIFSGVGKFSLIAPARRKNLAEYESFSPENLKMDFCVYSLPSLARYIKTNINSFLVPAKYYAFTGNNDIYHIGFDGPEVAINIVKAIHNRAWEYVPSTGYFTLAVSKPSYQTNGGTRLLVSDEKPRYPIIRLI
jgi:hypothetical protein